VHARISFDKEVNFVGECACLRRFRRGHPARPAVGLILRRLVHPFRGPLGFQRGEAAPQLVAWHGATMALPLLESRDRLLGRIKRSRTARRSATWRPRCSYTPSARLLDEDPCRDLVQPRHAAGVSDPVRSTRLSVIFGEAGPPFAAADGTVRQAATGVPGRAGGSVRRFSEETANSLERDCSR